MSRGIDADRQPASGSPPTWAAEVLGLWARVAGGDLALRVSPLAGTRAFEVSATGNEVHVAATDAVSACVGIHRYLTGTCGVRVTWDADLPLRLGALPDAPPVRGDARVDEFTYLNFCTFSYSTAYWGWAQWQREIDWMALHGVTMPLCLVGHEAVLARVYSARGLSHDRIRAFLGGPGYLPWLYMGCLDGFAGPLPAGWSERQLELGRRILARQRAFGMRPVLPAFTGHVPRELAPAGATTRRWQGMAPTTVLHPGDPLFRRLAAEIVAAQRDLLGTDHLYAADPFIEMLPTDTGDAADHPAAVAAAIADGLRAADPEAVWVLQSWPFSYLREYWTAERVARFLAGIPSDGVLVLDLWAEADPQWPRLDGYAGRPWIWNGLLNFGGRSEPVADLASTDRNLEAALAADRRPVGLGLAMEAIHTTPAFYELVTDRAWSAEPAGVGAWLRAFGRQRYGARDPAVDEVWDALRTTVLDADGRQIFPETFISVTVTKPDYTRMLDPDAAIHDEIRAALFYRPRDLLGVCRTLLETVAPAHEGSTPVANDLAHVCIAVLLRVIDHRFSDLVRTSLRTGRLDAAAAARFLETFDDLDDIAATRPTLRLDAWVEAATRRADDVAGRRVLAENARRLLTVWNTPGNPQLDNYSARMWSGLVRGHLKRRFELWLRFLPQALDPQRRAPAQAALDAELDRLAEDFITHGAPSAEPGGEVRTVARRVLDRYGSEFRALDPTKGTR
jgi:alpha-N-acetylglucosaminidase